ncbi:hypothetical protein [Nocardioides taihuensis]|uniref:Uncharacterized protein n=1 Tax=Nocardioides taihuensis TaxID=1835606 RepID=A0ABW0BEB5_9ACTN
MAVDKASRNRTGRPAKRNVITLLALANSDRAADVGVQGFADVKRTEIDHDWMSVHLFEEGWTPSEMDSRERTLLESEWVLRVVTLGSPFIRSLLDAGEDPRPADHWDAVSGLLTALKTFQGPGTKAPARAQYRLDLEAKLEAWPHSIRDLTPFWGAGQPRAATYEAALKKLLPGYDTKADGFLGVRPDFVVSPFKPCSVTAAVNDTNEAIRRAIRREAHVFEFTALAQPTAAGIRTYLRDKLPNYVQVTQEQ